MTIHIHSGMAKIAPLLLAIAIAITCQSLNSCGTAHHFLSPQPLEQKEWQIAVSWHWEVTTFQSRTNALIPGLFAYYGVTDDLAVGSGSLFPPGFPSCLTVAHYTESSPDEYWIAYGHWQAYGMGMNNPILEAGVGYSKSRGGLSSFAQAGVGYGHPTRWTGYMEPPDWTVSWNAKYGLRGRDVGVELYHYSGKAKREAKAQFPSWPPDIDTVAVYESGEITSIVDLMEYKEYYPMRVPHWGLVKQDGDTVVLYSPGPTPDGMAPDHRFILDQRFGDSVRFVHIGETWRDPWALVDLSEIKRAISHNEPVVICRTPRSVVDRIERINGWFEDNSLGWAAFGYDD